MAISASRLGKLGAEDVVWLVLTAALFPVAIAVAYDPSLDDPAAVLLAVMPWVMLGAVVVTFGHEVLGVTFRIRLVAIVVGLAAWSVIVLDDDRWSMMTFTIYALCYAAAARHVLLGVALSAIASTVWAVAWLIQDSPAWTVVMPFGVFAVGAAIAAAMYRSERLNQDQAALIEELRRTRAELAAAERSKGVLEERARMASEIHDTLAQGFASIVLVSRAAQRSPDGASAEAEALASIEQTAKENLDASRRLVEALQPPELVAASLPDALDRHIATALPGHVTSEFRVVGEPRQLTGAVEVTLLRAAQEALLNVRTHAHANQVDVTLSYLDDAVVLDVRDDGIGFVPGEVSDRGELTGGQGLGALEQRAQSLSGELTIEANDGGGSVVSVLLPLASAATP